MEGKMKAPYFVCFLAMVMTWGCLTFNYIGTGFSCACWAFLLFSFYEGWKKKTIPKVRLDPDLIKAFVVLYGTLLVVGGLQHDTVRNLMGPPYSAVDLLLITAPLWLILFTGWNYDIRKAITVAILGNMWAFALYGIWLYRAENQSRLTSFYVSPPEVGMFLDLLLPFTVCLTIFYWKCRWLRAAFALLIPMESIALFLTETRGSYLAFSVSGILLAAVWLYVYRHKATVWKKVLVCAVTVISAFAFISYAVSIGSESEKRMQGGERLLMWESSYRMWEDHKLLGIGLSEWKEQYNQPESPYHPKNAQETKNVQPHNIYLFFLAAGGAISFCALMGYIFFMLRYLLRKIREQEENPFSWGMLFIFLTLMTHGVVDGTLISRHIGRIFYFLMGTGILYTERWIDVFAIRDTRNKRM